MLDLDVSEPIEQGCGLLEISLLQAEEGCVKVVN